MISELYGGIEVILSPHVPQGKFYLDKKSMRLFVCSFYKVKDEFLKYIPLAHYQMMFLTSDSFSEGLLRCKEYALDKIESKYQQLLREINDKHNNSGKK